MTTIRSDARPSAQPLDGAPTDGDEERALEASGALARAATAFRHALDEVHEADDAAWEAYSRSLDDAVRQLQAELAVAQAQLDAERAARPEIVHDAVASAGEALQEQIDTLRVRAHLGRMDAETGLARTIDDIEHRAADVRAAARRVRSTAGATLDETRHTARVVLADIVDLVRLAASVVRDDLPAPHTPAGEHD